MSIEFIPRSEFDDHGLHRSVWRARIPDYEIDVYKSGYDRDQEWTFSVWWLGSHVESSRSSSWSFFDVKLNAEKAVERHKDMLAERQANRLTTEPVA
jgi:hypothetical protein